MEIPLRAPHIEDLSFGCVSPEDKLQKLRIRPMIVLNATAANNYANAIPI
jgi:hypothetical protein